MLVCEKALDEKGRVLAKVHRVELTLAFAQIGAVPAKALKAPLQAHVSAADRQTFNQGTRHLTRDPSSQAFLLVSKIGYLQ